MAFHEVRLPARLAFGSTGGVERRTEVVTLGSGFERRSTPWAHGRRRYLIAENLRSLDDMATLTAFFEARRGRLYGFRFRDFADFKSCLPGGSVAPSDQDLVRRGQLGRQDIAVARINGEVPSPPAPARLTAAFLVQPLARAEPPGTPLPADPGT